MSNEARAKVASLWLRLQAITAEAEQVLSLLEGSTESLECPRHDCQATRLRVKTLECERNAWRDSSNQYKAECDRTTPGEEE